MRKVAQMIRDATWRAWALTRERQTWRPASHAVDTGGDFDDPALNAARLAHAKWAEQQRIG